MFIPYLFIVFGLSGIVYVVLKKVPVLLKLPAEPAEALPPQPLKEKIVSRFKEISRLNYWVVFLSWIEKFLRRIRIIFLKLDNLIIGLISYLRKTSSALALTSKTWMSEKRKKRIEKLRMLIDLKRTSEEKEEILLRRIRQNPKDIKAYKEIGLLYLAEKNYSDAEAAFGEALKINPEDEMAKEKLEELTRLKFKKWSA